MTSLSGKTIEVLNTDAEGRLILADAITYAKRQGCTHLVDAATLTGAIAVAHVNVGAFSNDDAMLDRVLKAAKAQGEKTWHLPVDEEYREMLKSTFADIPNIAGRFGGSSTAWLDEAKPSLAKGPSGVPVRTFVHLAMNW